MTPRTPRTAAHGRPPAAGAGGPHDPLVGEGSRPTVEDAPPVVPTVGPQAPGARIGGEPLRVPGSTPRCWIVALPPRLETLSLNDRLHWSAQRRRAAAIKKAAWAIALHQKIPHLDSASVLVVYHPPDRRRRDHDNIPAASGKHAIDGLVAAKVLEDDCPPYVASVRYAIGEIVKGGQIVLHITEVPG
jgi:crossover junction endodeoxyribonuclease RusA